MAGKEKDKLQPTLPVNPISPRAIEGSEGYTAPKKTKKVNRWAALPQRTRDFQYITKFNNLKTQYSADDKTTLEEFLATRREKLQKRLKPTAYAIEMADKYATMSRDEQVALQYDPKLGYVSVQEKNLERDVAATTVSRFNNYNNQWATATPSIKREALLQSAGLTKTGLNTEDVEFAKSLTNNPDFSLAIAMGLNNGSITKRQVKIINKAMDLLELSKVFVNSFSDIAREELVKDLKPQQIEALRGLLTAVQEQYESRTAAAEEQGQNPIIGFLGATVGQVFEGLIWLNDNAQHLYRSALITQTEGGTVFSNWSKTELGAIESKELKRMNQTYGAKNVQVVRDVFVLINDEDGFAKLLEKYANDEEALYVINQIMYEQTRTPEIAKLIEDYKTISRDDLGNILANTILPDEWRTEDSGGIVGKLVWDYTDMATNFAGVWFGDPTLIAVKAAKGYKIMKYGLVKDGGFADIEKVLGTPKVQRFINNLTPRIDEFNSAENAAAQQKIRAEIKRDFGTYVTDDALDSMAQYFRETERVFETPAEAFGGWLREMNGIERLLMGRPVRAREFLAPRMTRSRQMIINRRLSKNKTISFDGSDDAFIKTIIGDIYDEASIRATFGLGPTDDIRKLMDSPEFVSVMRQVEAKNFTEALSNPQFREILSRRYGVDPSTLKFGRLDEMQSKLYTRGKRTFTTKGGKVKTLRPWSVSPSAWRRRTDDWLRNLENAPMKNVIKVADDSDADEIYNWLRTTFSRTFANYGRELWTYMGEGQRRLFIAAMFESIADARGIIGVNDVQKVNRQRIVTSSTRSNEKYGTVVSITDEAPDGTPFTRSYDTADFKGSQDALHVHQLAEYVRVPNFADVQLYSTKVTLLEKIIGWTYRGAITDLTSGWSTLNLAGPRYVQRAAIEDLMGAALTGVKPSEFFIGKTATQTLLEARGLSTGIVGEASRRIGDRIKNLFQRLDDTVVDAGIKQEIIDFNDTFYTAYRFGSREERYVFQGPKQNFSEISTPGTIIVSTEPEGILAEALRLSPQNKKLETLLNNFKSRQFGPEENDFLDSLLASVSVGRNGEKLAVENPSGFAVLLSALSGNKKAAQIIEKQVADFRNIIKQEDELRQAERRTRLEEWKSNYGQNLPDNVDETQIPVIHSTAYSVTRNPDGSISLFPFGYHTAGTTQAVQRASLHFTLEAPVQSHLFGKWDASQVKIVTDLSSMIKNNKVPFNLNAIDTWWMRSPGESVNITNASVIRPFTSAKGYKAELAKRGITVGDKDLPLIVVDSKTKDVLHVMKKNYTDKDRLQISKIAEDLELSSIGLSDGTSINLLGDTQLFVGRETEILDTLAVQLAKRELGIKSPPTKISGWGLTSKNAEERIRSLNIKHNVDWSIHQGTGPELLEKGSNSVSTKFFGESIEGMRFAALMGDFVVKPVSKYADDGFGGKVLNPELAKITDAIAKNPSLIEDATKTLNPAVAVSRQLGKLIKGHLSADEIIAAKKSLERGSTKDFQKLVSKAFLRMRLARLGNTAINIFKRKGYANSDVERALDAFASRPNFLAVGDEVAEFGRGDLNNFVAQQSVGRARKDLKPFLTPRSRDWERAITYASDPEIFVTQWYSKLHAFLHADGEMGQEVFKALFNNIDNVQRARAAAITRVTSVLEANPALAERFTAIGRTSIEQFATQSVDDTLHYFLKTDGTFNKKLIETLARFDEDGQMIGGKLYVTKGDKVLDEVDVDILKKIVDADDTAKPSHVLGMVEKDSARQPGGFLSRAQDTVWSWQSYALGRNSRLPIFTTRAITEYLDLEKLLLPIYKSKGLSDSAAQKMLAEVAEMRAEFLAVSYMDNPQIRSIGAYSVRNIARYYRATEDFFRRVTRATKFNPEALQKINILYGSMQETGFTWKDENGESYFMYPGTGGLHKAIATVFNMLPFPGKMYTISPYSFGGNLSMLTPSADQDAWMPTFSSPIAGLMTKVFTNMGPFEELESWLLGPKGTKKAGGVTDEVREYLDAVLPSHLKRAFNLLDRDDRESQYAAAVRGAIQILAYNGDLDDVKTESQRKEIFDKIERTAFGNLVTRFILGFMVPASPQAIQNQGLSDELRALGVPDLRQGYLQLLNKYDGDYEKANAVWYKLNPELFPFTVSSSGNVIGGAPAATLKSLDWLNENSEFAKKYMQAAIFLSPSGGNFSMKAYGLVRSLGYTQPKETREYFVDAITAGDKYMYYLSKEAYEKDREQALTSYERNLIDERWRDIKNEMIARNPWLEEVVMPDSLGEVAKLRKDALTEMRSAINDIYKNGAAPRSKTSDKIYTMLGTFDAGMRDLDKYRNGNSEYFTYNRRRVRDRLMGVLEQVAGKNEGATNFYERILKPLIEG